MNISERHPHYHKDVSSLNKVDVYRVLALFDVTDPCLQHAVKKLLVSGKRGAKDRDRDVQDAIDTLLRFQEMQIENNLNSSMAAELEATIEQRDMLSAEVLRLNKALEQAKGRSTRRTGRTR